MPDSIQQSLKNNLQWIPFWHDCTDYSYLKIEFSYQSIFHQMQTPAIFVRFNFFVCFFALVQNWTLSLSDTNDFWNVLHDCFFQSPALDA